MSEKITEFAPIADVSMDAVRFNGPVMATLPFGEPGFEVRFESTMEIQTSKPVVAMDFMLALFPDLLGICHCSIVNGDYDFAMAEDRWMRFEDMNTGLGGVFIVAFSRSATDAQLDQLRTLVKKFAETNTLQRIVPEPQTRDRCHRIQALGERLRTEGKERYEANRLQLA